MSTSDDAQRELPVPNPDALARRLEDEVVLVHLGTNRIFSLNRTGARFWELLTSGCTRSEIEAGLQEEFDVSPDALAAEIDTLLTALEAEDLVRPAGAAQE